MLLFNWCQSLHHLVLSLQASKQGKAMSHVCSGSTAQEEIDLPAKRIWEAKVLAPTKTAGRRFVLWSRWKPTKAAFQWMAGKMGWWPVE